MCVMCAMFACFAPASSKSTGFPTQTVQAIGEAPSERGCHGREQVFSKLCQTLDVLCHSRKERRVVGSVVFESLSKEELEDELVRLKDRLGMSLDVAKATAQAHVLEADKFRILCRIEDLQWLRSMN